MPNYDMTVWALVGGWDSGLGDPTEVAPLPENGGGITEADDVVVVDISDTPLLSLATTSRSVIPFTATTNSQTDVGAAALAALNSETSGSYTFHQGLADHRCTPNGCVPGAVASGHFVFLVASNGSLCGDTGMRASESALALRYAVSVSPAS